MTENLREGIDYLVDLYAVAGIEREAEQEEIKRALNQRLTEYHPDRLEGLAPEFQARGEHMARLLNRAKTILLDPERRQGYNEILVNWEGPVSTSGNAVITWDNHLRGEVATMSSEEIETMFAEQAGQIEAATGYTPTRVSFLEELVIQAGDNVSDALRAQYEDALLSHDRALSIQEAERSRLLSLPDIGKKGYSAGLDYAETIAGEIESARTARKEELRMKALGGVSTQLALLAGEPIEPSTSSAIVEPFLELPAYFDQQAEKVREIAAKRQEIVEKRLANFQPTYPLPELQTEAKTNLLIGIGEDTFRWFGAVFNLETNGVNVVPVPQSAIQLLEAANFEPVIEAGYSVLTFAPLDQIDLQTQLLDAIEKHAAKLD